MLSVSENASRIKEKVSSPASAKPEVSVVVVNYRTWDDTAQLLDELERQLPQDRFELLVVNNCNQTPLPDPLRKTGVRFVESVRNVGFAGAVNLATACAESPLLLILNPDIRPHPGALAALLDAHKRNAEAGVIVPRLKSDNGKEQASIRTFYRLETVIAARTPWGRTRRGRQLMNDHLAQDLDKESEQPVDWGLGAAMLIDLKRIPLERGRLMDDRFFLYMEDVDLCMRTWLSGHQVIYTPNAVFTHQHKRESRRKPISMANLRHFLSLLRFMVKYRGLPSRPTGLPKWK